MIIPGKFSYLHIPKTGGTAVERMLIENFTPNNGEFYNKNCIPEYVKYGLNGRQHMDAMGYPLDLPIFTFIRNPYDRALSAFNYLKRRGDTQCESVMELVANESNRTHVRPQFHFVNRFDVIKMNYEHMQGFLFKMGFNKPLETVNYNPPLTKLTDGDRDIIDEVYAKDWELLREHTIAIPNNDTVPKLN